MLKIDEDPCFWSEVKVTFPGTEPIVFSAQFRAVDIMDENQTVEDFLKRVVINLQDVGDSEGKAYPFTKELLDRVVAKSHLRAALFKAYQEGLAAAIRGN